MSSAASRGRTSRRPATARRRKNEQLGQSASDGSRLYVLCLGDLMIVLDVTIVGVALPSIRTDLGFSETSLAWIVNAYLLTFGGFLLLGGRLGDLFGHRRLFVIGTTLFTIASLACGLSNSQELLIGARAVQGIGAAIVSAVALSLMMTLFTEAADRAKAMGIFGFVASGGGSIGVLLGGVLTDVLSWHWIFLVNVPVGVLVVLLTMKLVPSCRGHGRGAPPRCRGRGHRHRRADAGGLRDRQRQPGRLDLRPDARRARRGDRPVRDLHRHRVEGALAADAARASSGCTTSWSRTSSASSGRRRCSPGSSCRRSTSSWCWGTARCRSAWPSCPGT